MSRRNLTATSDGRFVPQAPRRGADFYCLREACGLTAATVFELDSETGLLNPAARVGHIGAHDLLTAGKVFRQAAGAAPVIDGTRMAIRLRIGAETGSVGYAMFPEDATTYEALMRQADEAMYEAKRDLKAHGGGSRRANPAA
jgi:hypothetical protein